MNTIFAQCPECGEIYYDDINVKDIINQEVGICCNCESFIQEEIINEKIKEEFNPR